MSPQELIQNAHSVEAQGLPIDWKALCMKVFQSANDRIVELEGRLDDNQKEHKAESDE